MPSMPSKPSMPPPRRHAAGAARRRWRGGMRRGAAGAAGAVWRGAARRGAAGAARRGWAGAAWRGVPAAARQAEFEPAAAAELVELSHAPRHASPADRGRGSAARAQPGSALGAGRAGLRAGAALVAQPAQGRRRARRPAGALQLDRPEAAVGRRPPARAARGGQAPVAHPRDAQGRSVGHAGRALRGNCRPDGRQAERGDGGRHDTGIARRRGAGDAHADSSQSNYAFAIALEDETSATRDVFARVRDECVAGAGRLCSVRNEKLV